MAGECRGDRSRREITSRGPTRWRWPMPGIRLATTPQLGDGRAILLGEIVGRDGTRRDLQLKGAGGPLFAVGMGGPPSAPLREYILSEAMRSWAFRRRARWWWSPRGSQSSGRRFSPGPCSPAWRPATYASARLMLRCAGRSRGPLDPGEYALARHSPALHGVRLALALLGAVCEHAARGAVDAGGVHPRGHEYR